VRRIARLLAAGSLATTLLAVSVANAQEKRHQATGTIGTSSPTQLVLLKQFGRNQAHWNFVLNPKTKLEGKLTKGERVRIYYYDDPKGQRVAEQVKIIEQANASPAAPAKAAAAALPPTQSQPAH
jgi:hypothetical protein